MIKRMSIRVPIVLALALLGSMTARSQESPPAEKTPPGEKEEVAKQDDDKPAATENPVRSSPTEFGKPRQPSQAEIIEVFEKDRPVNTVVRPREWKNGTPPASRGTGSRSEGLLREGEYIHNKVGRLVRAGAWWAFRFESDSPDARQPSMKVLPNQQLERLVMEVTASAESPVFVVSGEVTLFESQNFVMLRKVLRRRTPQNLQK